LLATAALLVGTGHAQSDPPKSDAPKGPPDILATAGGAVAQNLLQKTPAAGFHLERRLFTELPREGAILVGFDLGLGKFFNVEVVYAYRPIYLTGRGKTSFRSYGLFAELLQPGKKPLKSKVHRTVRVLARPEYAVGAVTVRSGLLINGLAVTFMRINGQNLDPLETYNSVWIGDRTGGSETTVSGFGSPVVGVFGSQEDDHVKSLGLFYVSRAPVEAEPQLVPELKEQPAPPRPVQPEDRSPPPLDQLAGAAGAVTAKQATKDQTPKTTAPEAPAPVQEKPAAESPPTDKGLGWMPVLIVGAALVPMLLLVVVYCAKRPGGPGPQPQDIPEVRRASRRPKN
jgi:hypothetical protein